MWWWFIPAGAGNTPAYADITSSSSVYPRWRGEHIYRSCSVRNGIGLSPLARGTPELGSARHADIRFIPAGAGNTMTISPCRGFSAVYPRWRGEHISICPRTNTNGGLSPLARGTRLQVIHRVKQTRFIPAGAGNTMVKISTFRRAAVYPRWRGEHATPLLLQSGITGLSPLARGTQVR